MKAVRSVRGVEVEIQISTQVFDFQVDLGRSFDSETRPVLKGRLRGQGLQTFRRVRKSRQEN